MTSELTIIEPAHRKNLAQELSLTISEGQLDRDLAKLNKQEQLEYILESIVGLADIQLKISQAVLNLMYKVYSNKLYLEEMQPGQPRYDTFNEWAYNVLLPLLEGRVDRQTVVDWIRITNNVLSYTLLNGYTNNPVKVSAEMDKRGRSKLVVDPNGTPVTAQGLIGLVGYGRLKMASSHMPTEKRDANGHAIITDVLTLSHKGFKAKYEAAARCDYTVQYLPDGTADITFKQVSTEMVDLLMNRLRHNGNPHIINAENRKELAG